MGTNFALPGATNLQHRWKCFHGLTRAINSKTISGHSQLVIYAVEMNLMALIKL
jgi:hypothetical protein